MRITPKTSFVCAIIGVFFCFGCRKGSGEEQAVITETVTSKTDISKMKDVFFSGELDYEHRLAKYSPDNSIVRSAIPFKETEDSKLFRYLIIEKKTFSREESKSYFATKIRLTAQSDLFSLPFQKGGYYFNDRASTKDAMHRKGVRFKKEKLTQSYDLDTPVTNGLPPCGSQPGVPGEPVCIDWYWEVWDADTGEIISSEYLYTTCYDPCNPAGPGGGGGGSSNPCLEACQVDFNNEYNGASLPSTGDETFQVTTINGLKKYKNPRWKILNGWSGWYLFSEEEGIVELVDVAENIWWWRKLSHKGMSMEGMPPPGVGISYSQGSGTPSFVEGANNVLYAGINVYFTVTYSALCSNCLPNGVLPNKAKGYENFRFWSAIP